MHNKLVTTLIAFGLVAGCSDKMEPLKPAMSCAIAASVLNQNLAAQTALAKSVVIRESKGIKISTDDALKLHNDIREGWLQKSASKSKNDQIAYVLAVFNSPDCLAITESRPLNASDIDMSKIADPKSPAK